MYSGELYGHGASARMHMNTHIHRHTAVKWGDTSFRYFGKSASAILTSLGKVKGKAIPVQSCYRLWGFQEVEAPRFLDNRDMKVVSLSALRTDRLYTPGNIPGTYFC